MLTNQRRGGGELIPIVFTVVALVILLITGWTNAISDERRSSDLFWSYAWIDGVQAEGYTSIEDIYSRTDAVVLGRLTSIQPGRVIGDVENDNAAYYVTVTLDLERVLRSRPGAVPASGTIQLELVTFQKEVVGSMVDSFAPERGLFFLTSKGLNAERAGEPKEVQIQEMSYYRLAVADGVLRDIGGQLFTRPSLDESLFTRLHTSPFDSAVEEIASGS